MKKISLANSENFLCSNHNDDLYIIKTRQFFMGYIIFLEFCKKRGLYRNGNNVNEIIFMKSKVYNFFMEISKFIFENKIVNVNFFIKYILSNNINFKDWNTQNLYLKYLNDLNTIEPPDDAFYRSLLFLEKWAEINNTNISDFFKINNENYILFTIENKLISPWLLYSCDEGKKFLFNLDISKLPKLKNDLNKTKWEFKLKLHKDKVRFFENILKEKGL